MAEPIDILLLLPEVAAIGHVKLQCYCNEWLKRPIARQFGIVQLNVRSDLLTDVLLDANIAASDGVMARSSIAQLIEYIIDQHFKDPDQRRQLHAQLRDARKRMGDEGRIFEATIGRVGTLYLKCKNPKCAVLMETPYKATEGMTITVKCPPTELCCPVCGRSNTYSGSDLRLVFPKAE